MLFCDEMQGWCLRPSRGCARLDGWVDSTTGVLRSVGDTVDVIDMEEYPATEAERAEALEWCSPCGHLYYAKNIRRWMRGRKAPACPECHGKIEELVPYGMTLAGLHARRAAEAAATAVRVAAARQAYEPMRVAMIHERLRNEQEANRRVQDFEAILVKIERCRGAAVRCETVLRNRVNVRSSGMILLRAEHRLCADWGHVLQTHRDVLHKYIGNLRGIVHLCTSEDDRWQMAFAGDMVVTVEEATIVHSWRLIHAKPRTLVSLRIWMLYGMVNLTCWTQPRTLFFGMTWRHVLWVSMRRNSMPVLCVALYCVW